MVPSVSVFKDLVNKDLEQLQLKRSRGDLTFNRGLELLKSRSDIVVRPADKGGGIVIFDSEAYNLEMLRLLSDRDTCVPLTGNSTTKYKKDLVCLVDSDRTFLPKKRSSFWSRLSPGYR